MSIVKHFISLNVVPLPARILGVAGLIPFCVGGSVGWLDLGLPIQLGLIDICITYAALILSFLGGVRWGANMTDNDPFLFSLSVIPTLLALAALLFPAPLACLILFALFVALGVIDIHDSRHGVIAPWYAPLRLWLSLGACLSLISIFLSFSKLGLS